MDGDGSGEDSDDLGDNVCKGRKDTTDAAELYVVVCSDERSNVESKGKGHSVSEERVRYIDHVLPYKPISA